LRRPRTEIAGTRGSLGLWLDWEVELGDATRGVGGRSAAGQLGSDLAAVRLMPDRDQRLSKSVGRGEQVVKRRSGREPVVDSELGSCCPGDRGRGLAGAQEWAREHHSGRSGSESLADGARLLAAGSGQGSQLVGVTGRRFRVANEKEPHRFRIGP
jgi:hypothetical protein